MREYWLGWRGALLAVLMLIAAGLQLPLWSWEVEDAAISLAYARNLAAGDGLVAQVGAERVEGFSDPLWVACIAALNWLGADPFATCRWLGLLFGCATVPAVWLALRPLEKELPLAPACGAGAIALYAPHAIWAQSGLENALFSFLLALGCARLTSGKDGEWLGPLAFLGVAWTRPEGVAYAAVAGCLSIAAGRSWRRVGTRIAVWTLAFGLPLLASEGARLWYFGQELPATFHAKLGNGTLRPLDSGHRGWTQLRAFAADTWSVLLVPLMVVGASGAREWRWVSAVVAIGVLAGAWIDPTVPLLAVILALPLLAVGRKLPVGLAASLLLVALAFHIGTGGDWMKGYRWMSFAAVPGAMLVGVGIAELAERFELLRLVAPAIGGAMMVPQVLFVVRYSEAPEVKPSDIERRLDHWLSVARRLQMDGRPRIVDHDMGGNLYFGGDKVIFRDARGLVDLPFALYGREATVVTHELFEDRPFDFAHAHASTGAAVNRNAKFRKDYVQIESYGSNRNHGGQYLRRSLFLTEGWSGPPMEVTFAGGVRILGLSVPSPEIGAGAGVYFELGVDAEQAPFRMIAFLSDAERVLASWDLPPAHDWVPPKSWRPEEVFHGRFAVSLPAELPDGDYDLGFVVLDAAGAVLPVLSAAGPAQVPEAPRFAVGEVRVPGVVKIVPREEMGRLALADRTEALARADAGRCEAAETSWNLALWHRARSRQWRDANRPPVARAIARCLSLRAAVGPKDGEALLDRVRELEAARSWDPREPAVWSNARAIADEARQRALATEEPTERFRWAEAAVRADPRRSWDRRLAEQARGTWIGVERDRDDGGPER